MAEKTPSAQQKRYELHRNGYMPGKCAGNTCCECSAKCGYGWWQQVSIEYGEWECWCRECAYERLHRYDDFDFDEIMRTIELENK